MTTRLILHLPELLRLSIHSAECGDSADIALLTGIVLEGAPVPGMICFPTSGVTATAAELVDISWSRGDGPVRLALQCVSPAARDALLAAAAASTVMEGRLPAITPPVA